MTQQRDIAPAEAKGFGSAWPAYRRLVGYTFRYKWRLLAMVLLSIVSAVSFTSLIVSAAAIVNFLFEDEARINEQVEELRGQLQTTGDVIESAIGWDTTVYQEQVVDFALSLRENRREVLLKAAMVLVALVLLAAFARFLQEYYAGSIGARVAIQLNDEMFDNILKQSHGFFEARTTGDVVARFTSDAMMVNRGLVNVFTKLFREPIKVTFLLCAALVVDVYLTLVVVFVLSPLFFVLLTIGRRVRKSVRRSLTKVAAVASIVAETVSGIAIIKSFRMENYQQRRLSEELRRLRKQLIRLVQADAAVAPSVEALLIIGVAVFVILGQQRITDDSLSILQLGTLFGCLAAAVDPLRKLAKVNNMIVTSAASAERVFAYIDMEPSVKERADAVDLPVMRDSLRFENVRFSYDGRRDVLEDVNLEIRRGQMIALVGFSGAGKSTIAKLIPRFYDPTAGRITIDGVDVRDVTLESLRDQIALVTQDTMLFRASVRENIAFGRESFTDESVRQAAATAHAAEFIEALPDGYDTILSESGGTLSGGQRQRLAIARAIIKDPAILILDEATSNLDSESERAIQEAMEEVVVGRATLVIAHRLSTVQRADRLIVMDAGRVVETGTHRELIANGGIYRRLYELQFAPGHTAESA